MWFFIGLAIIQGIMVAFGIIFTWKGLHTYTSPIKFEEFCGKTKLKKELMGGNNKFLKLNILINLKRDIEKENYDRRESLEEAVENLISQVNAIAMITLMVVNEKIKETEEEIVKQGVLKDDIRKQG
jgi:hypothetical protein